MGKAVTNIRNLAYNMTIAKINNVKSQLLGYNGRQAADATRYLVSHSLKIQSYIYSMILGVEVVINNINQLLGTTTLSVDEGFLVKNYTNRMSLRCWMCLLNKSQVLLLIQFYLPFLQLSAMRVVKVVKQFLSQRNRS